MEAYFFADKSALPSDYFKRQCFMSFQEDAIGMRERETVGLETLMWGSDYPHTESTFPRSREILERILADVPEPERLGWLMCMRRHRPTSTTPQMESRRCRGKLAISSQTS